MPPRLAAWRQPSLAALLGALQTLAFVHTALWALPLLATAWLAWRAGRASVRGAALLGFVFGSAWLGAGVWWLFISMHRYGGLPAPLAAAAVALLAAALSAYLALALALYARWRQGRAAFDVPLFAALWLLAELARGVLFTGFPWLASGYAQVDAPLAVLAPWVGVYGIGAVGAGLAAALATGRRGALGAAALLAALAVVQVAGPAGFSQPTGTLRLALLQPNVAQDEKFAPDRMPETLTWVGRALVGAEADLVVGPETVVPLLPDQLEAFSPGYWASLVDHFAQPGRAALLGVPLGDYERGYTNSVVGLSANGANGAKGAIGAHGAAAAYRYDKAHLVPFGEFIPTGFRWFTELMNIPLGDFARGVPRPPSFAVDGERVAPNICYEDLFGEELARRFGDAASAPTIFANVSNIGWFGDTIALPQHLNISRLRSLEFERPMLRATNTGTTAVIDHRGVVTAMLAPYTRGVLETAVQGRTGLTPFAWWAARFGLWPLLGLALATVAAVCLSAGRRRSAPAGPAARR